MDIILCVDLLTWPDERVGERLLTKDRRFTLGKNKSVWPVSFCPIHNDLLYNRKVSIWRQRKILNKI
jgi:hypothetical protein